MSIKKQITVSQERYIIILDALEIMESKVAGKLRKTINPKKRAELKDLNISIQEIINDMVDIDDEALS